jgi:hypothetical protein
MPCPRANSSCQKVLLSSPKEVSALYEKNIKQLESIGFSPRFGAYREHLLAYAASKDIHLSSYSSA